MEKRFSDHISFISIYQMLGSGFGQSHSSIISAIYFYLPLWKTSLRRLDANISSDRPSLMPIDIPLGIFVASILCDSQLLSTMFHLVLILFLLKPFIHVYLKIKVTDFKFSTVKDYF